jgi:cysteine desulfuration protein SufE
MLTINEIQDEIIAEFSELDDWMDRYQLLIDMGSEQEPLPEKEKNESNLIDGCQSRVWLVCDEHDGVLTFRAESDALIVKGIVSLLIKVLSGHTAQEILDADLYFIKEIGLAEHLSPTRSNGLLAMLKQMRMYALVYQSKNK